MDLVFQAPLRGRFHRYGMSITTFWPEAGAALWWSSDLRRWCTHDEARVDEWKSNYSSHCPRVRTLKAFRRHLRKHADSLRGYRVIWVNKFQGHDVEIQL